MDVSVIIVNYNTAALTLQCLRTLYEYIRDVSFEVIVVDNHSSDDSITLIENEFPQVVLLKSNVNMGFGRANNWAATQARGKYLFLLNSDTIVINNIIKMFYDYMEKHPETASCGGNLLDVQGANTVSHGCFPSLFQEFSDIGFRKLYRKKYVRHLSTGQKINEGNIDDVDYISGADIFIRKSVFESMTGFDSNIFMYYEETDLYYRMAKVGMKSCLLPYACLVHLEGGSSCSKRAFSFKRYEMSWSSKLYFFRKNYGTQSLFGLKLFTLLSVIFHFYHYKSSLYKVLELIIKS